MKKVLIQSYLIPFARGLRDLNFGKKKAVNDILYNAKNITNLMYKDMFDGVALWDNMSKEDKTFVRQHYEKYATETTGIKSCYTQNMVQGGISGFFDTLKSLKAINKNKSFKSKLHKPYQKDLKTYNLDNRHYKDNTKKNGIISINNPLHKDQNTGIYYFGIKSPYKDQKGKIIWLPLTGYKYIRDILDSICNGSCNDNYSFGLNKDGISLIVQKEYVIDELGDKKSVKDLQKLGHKIENNAVLGLDFGKRIATSDGKMYDLSKMYRKIKKLQGQISNLDSRIKKLKNDKDFGLTYDKLKLEVSKLHKRILGIRKSSYYHIINKILIEMKNTDKTFLSVEDLTFTTIEKESSSYKGRNFNKVINIMGKGIWLRSLTHAINKTLGCSQMIKMASNYTSQTCFSCLYTDKKSRNGLKFNCSNCGYLSHSDTNASKILYLIGCLSYGSL